MTTKLQHPRGRPQVEAKCVPAWGTHTMCPALKACQLLSLFRQLSAARVCNRACQGPVWVKHVGGRGGAGVPVCVHDSSLRSPAPPPRLGRRAGEPSGDGPVPTLRILSWATAVPNAWLLRGHLSMPSPLLGPAYQLHFQAFLWLG